MMGEGHMQKMQEMRSKMQEMMGMMDEMMGGEEYQGPKENGMLGDRLARMKSGKEMSV